MESRDELPDIDGLWDYYDPAATEQEFRNLIRVASEAGREQYLAELFTQIARTEGLQGRFDDAGQDLDRAEALIADAVRPKIRLLLERGRVLNSSGHPAEAKPFFVEAFELALACGEEFLAIDAAHMVAIVEDQEQSLAWNRRGLELARLATDQRAAEWEGSLLNNMGWTYHDLGRYDEALDHFQKNLALEQKRGRDRESRIASWTIARCLRSMGRPDEALVLQEKNLAAAEAAGGPDGFIQEELGECLLALGRAEEARPHFARAFELLSKDGWLSRNEPERIQRLRELSDS